MPLSGRNANINRCHDAATDHPNEHANRMIWYVPPFLISFVRVLTSAVVSARESKSTGPRIAVYAAQSSLERPEAVSGKVERGREIGC